MFCTLFGKIEERSLHQLRFPASRSADDKPTGSIPLGGFRQQQFVGGFVRGQSVDDQIGGNIKSVSEGSKPRVDRGCPTEMLNPLFLRVDQRRYKVGGRGGAGGFFAKPHGFDQARFGQQRIGAYTVIGDIIQKFQTIHIVRLKELFQFFQPFGRPGKGSVGNRNQIQILSGKRRAKFKQNFVIAVQPIDKAFGQDDQKVRRFLQSDAFVFPIRAAIFAVGCRREKTRNTVDVVQGGIQFFGDNAAFAGVAAEADETIVRVRIHA